MNGHVPVKRVEISAVKILRDGSRRDLGTLAVWHANPLMRAWLRAVNKLKRAVA